MITNELGGNPYEFGTFRLTFVNEDTFNTFCGGIQVMVQRTKFIKMMNVRKNVGKDEKLVCMIALGYGETQGVPRKIKSVEDVSRSAVRTLGSSKNASDITPSWFRKGVEAALLAPTAVNQQKFSFEYVGMNNNRHQVQAKKGISMIGYTQMDLGIAKYHFEIGADNTNFDWV